MIRGARHGALARTQTFLAMARRDDNGRWRLTRDRLRITWPDAGYRRMYHRSPQRFQQMTRR